MQIPNIQASNKEHRLRDFPRHPVAKNQQFQCGAMGSIPSQGIKIPHSMWCDQKQRKYNKETKNIDLDIASF